MVAKWRSLQAKRTNPISFHILACKDDCTQDDQTIWSADRSERNMLKWEYAILF